MNDGAAFTGGAGADTFSADLSGGANTLNVLDRLTGGAGTDTLNVVIVSSVTPSSLAGIETINVTGTAGATLGLANAADVTSVNSVSTAGGTLIVTGIAAGAALSITTSAEAHDFQYASTTGTQSVALAVSGVTAGTVTLAGIETVTTTASGSANTYVLKTAAATTLNFAGGTAQTVTLDAATLSVTKFDASAATAAVTLTTIDQTAIASAATVVTVLGGAGNDSLTLVESNKLSVDGGAGNDTITIAAIDLDDTVSGGDGTADVLVTVAAQANVLDAATPTTYTVSGFEQITVTDLYDGELIVANIDTGITKVTLGNGTAGVTDIVTGGDDTVTGGAGSFSLDLGTSFAGNTSTLDGALVVKDTGTATTDSVTISNKAVNSTSKTSLDVFDGQALTSTGYENVTIATGTASNLVQQDISTLTITPDSITGTAVSLTVTGDNSLVIGTSLTTTATGLMTVNASGMTARTAGTTTFGIAASTMGTGGTQSITGSAGDDSIIVGAFKATIDGGAGNDTITGGTTTADSLSGGDGRDTIDGGGGNDTISGGAGNDTITVTGTSVSVDGGAGDDTVIMTTTTSSGDTLVGGDGTDTLSITGAITTGTIGSVVSGFETLLTSATAQVMSNFTNNTFTSITQSAASNGTLAITNANASLATLTILDTDTLVTSFARLADGAADSLTVVAGATIAGGSDALTASGEETIVINVADFAADLDLVTSTSLKTLTIIGDNTTVIDAQGATALATVNASAFTGTATLNVDASDSTTALTFTGGTSTGNATITSGTGADTITAGSGILNATTGGGADTVTGGGLADIISTGSANDSIFGGEGIDSITGGGGSDTINLTETTAVSDVVVLDSTGIDTITGFAAGASGDEFELSLAGLITNLGVTQLTLLGTTATAAANLVGTGTNAVIQSIANQAGGSAVAADATATVFLLVGESFATTGDVENALETGDYELTLHGDATTGDAFTVIYSDGTDSYVALVRLAANPTTNFASGDLTVTNMVKLVGNPSITTDEFVAGNFDYIT